MSSVSLAGHFRADNLILHPLADCFCTDHSTLYLSIPRASYFRSDHSILHPVASCLSADYLTVNPSIPLASYFCARVDNRRVISGELFQSELFW